MKSAQILMMGNNFNQQGKYTYQQLDDLINIDGYIPVATALELNGISIGDTKTMGEGTPWEDEYTYTNEDSFVQIVPIDYTGITSIISGFNGVYDGNLVAIYNLYLTADTTGVGLFQLGNTSTFGEIRNVIVSGEIITSAQQAGLLTGSVADGWLIEDCYANGTVENTGNSSGGSRGGILVGQNTGTIKRCYSSGSVISTYSASGGLVGLNNGTIENCYSNADVEGTTAIGGLVGNNLSGSITNSYTIGEITATSGGGLCGSNASTITNSYYNTDIYPTSSGGTGKTTTEMQEGSIPDTAIYVSWDDTIWDAVDDNTYPELINV